MKTGFLKNTIIIVAIILLAACSKNYLDETPQGNKISSDQILDISKEDPTVNEGFLRGIYALMYTPNAGRIFTEEDFGHKSLDLYSDILSSDIALRAVSYNWYSGFTNFDATKNYTSNQNYLVWRYLYRIVLATNSIVDALGGNDAVLKDIKSKHIMGQAKTMRGYAYFYLTQLLVPSYDRSSKIIPIYKTVKDINKPQSTTGEVYDLIIDDLQHGIKLLTGFERTDRSQVNADIAKALLAYTYASMGNKNQEVIRLTKEVINAGYKLVPYDLVLEGFNDINKYPWMWGVDLKRGMKIGIRSWWGAFDLFTYGYPSVGDTKMMDSNLYEAIKDTDIRKQQFIAPNHPWYGDFGLTGYKKFYHQDRKFDGQRVVTTDYVYMRVAEMYLLHAETATKEGQYAAARESLKAVLKERFKNATDYSYVDALSGKALEDEIYLQTRIELWAEGKSYLAMKRNKKTVTRGNNHLTFSGKSYSYNAPELSFIVPQTEILNNPNIN